MHFVFHCHGTLRGLKRANNYYNDKSDHKHVKLCASLFLYVQIFILALKISNSMMVCPDWPSCCTSGVQGQVEQCSPPNSKNTNSQDCSTERRPHRQVLSFGRKIHYGGKVVPRAA